MRDTGPIVERLNQARATLLAVAEGVPGEKWRQAPAGGGWSAGEVIAHLTQVEAATLEGASRVLKKEPRPVRFRDRLHIPPKVVEWRLPRAKTPIPLDPALLGEKQAMLDRFRAGRERTLAFIDSQRHRDLGRWRWRHPFLGPLDTYTWFETLYHHEIRHTKQLREIVGLIGDQ